MLRPLARIAFATALVTLVTVPAASRAVAQQTDKQRQLTQQIEETDKQTQQARAAAAAAQAERAKFDATLAGLQTQLAAAQATLASAQADVDRLGLAAFLLAVDIDKTGQKLAVAEADVKKSALLMYKSPDGASPINLIGAADGSGSIVEGKHYLKRVSEVRRDDLARATRLRNKLSGQKDDLAVQQQQADAAKATAEATTNQIATLVAQQ
ncbi:MAG: hypothetical protein ABWY80_06460, partial [Acidimicrobiia bacterium]